MVAARVSGESMGEALRLAPAPARRNKAVALNVVDTIDDRVRVNRVIVSVSDKRGLEGFVRGLVEINPEVTLYSTGGTYGTLKAVLGPTAAGKNLLSISDYTGQPEMQGGLVKTLDFRIYLGLLSETYNDAHRADLRRAAAAVFDMVVVNLYPFRETVAKADATPELARTHIDIGGPCMVRAAAKNFLRVASVTDPEDYPVILAELRGTGGCLSLESRFALARKAFAHTAGYDAAIAEYLAARRFSDVKGCYRRPEPG
jgi:phosphoribosylaminoimidazolecarboxamide formyltransferase/IMP cyclohydrolase